MATNDVGTKYPLSSVHETGIEDLKRLGLDSELGNAYPESIAALWDLAVSAHAPSHTGEHLPNFGAPGGDLVHLNIAATDEDFRRLSQTDVH